MRSATDAASARPLVLLVGPGEDDRAIYGEGLKALGLRTECIDASADVAAPVLSLRPDVIVLHLGLPEDEGWSVVDALHQDPNCRRIPVILLTAAVRPDGLNRARARRTPNCAAFVAKPCDPDALAVVVRRILKGDRNLEILFSPPK